LIISASILTGRELHPSSVCMPKSRNSIETARFNIEDVDYALEMSELAKNQILVQSGTAMLAQANMVSQNILQLLSN